MGTPWISATIAGLILCLIGCDGGGDETDCSVGAEGCSCTGGGGCDPGLTCLSSACVDAGGDTGSGPAEDTFLSPETTWTDPASGLTWRVEPTGSTVKWNLAKEHCQDLSLDGAGWRLPNIGELRSLVRGCPATEDGGICNVGEWNCLAWSCWDDSCFGCSSGDGPADGCYWPDEMQGSCDWYWSTTPVPDGGGDPAWGIDFNNGSVKDDNGGIRRVRCVR